MMHLGQEISKTIPFLEAERGPTAKELALWTKAQRAFQRANLLSYALKLQYRNVILTYSFGRENEAKLDEKGLPDLEIRTLNAISEIERLKDLMSEVNQLEIGVRLSEGGNDLDIIQPSSQIGWVIPAVIGAAVVIGIIARWAFLEKEVGEISDQYNGILRRANIELCADPNSTICKNWETTKKNGGYYKRETIIDKVKNAAIKVGNIAAKGLGAGIAIAIPLFMLLYLPKRKGK